MEKFKVGDRFCDPEKGSGLIIGVWRNETGIDSSFGAIPMPVPFPYYIKLDNKERAHKWNDSVPWDLSEEAYIVAESIFEEEM